MLNVINSQPVRSAFFRILSGGVIRIALAVGLAAASPAAWHQTAAAQSLTHVDPASVAGEQKAQCLTQAEAGEQKTRSLSEAESGVPHDNQVVNVRQSR